MFKKKFGLYSENLNVSKNCATCKFGRQLASVDDVICEKSGLVSAKHICKHYDYNRLMKRPGKKHTIGNKSFSENDFSIE